MTADELPLRRAVLGESVSGDILEGIRPDGQVTTVLASAAPPFDEQGRARGAVGAFVDITEQMRAENELRKQSVELSAVNKELEAFNSAVAHDLRAPLRHIHGFAQILADDAGPKQNLKTIQNSANHRRQLLEDLLNLSKLGRQELHKQVGILNPHPRPSRALLPHIDFIKQIRAGVLNTAQFPATLTDAHGTFTKPATW